MFKSLPSISLRRRILNSTKVNLLLVLLAFAGPSTAEFKNDFSDYPSGTHDCLNDANDSSNCTGDTSAEMNQCLCSNGGNFVTNSAECIAAKDPGDLLATWEEMETHCSDSNTPLTVQRAQWMAYQTSSSSSSSATSTPTSTPTPTSSSSQQTVTVTGTSTPAPDPKDDEDESSGLSSGARIGIIAGSAAAGVALLAAALFFFIRYRKRRHHEYDQVQPMLLANTPHGPSNGADTAYSNAYSREPSSANPSHVSMGPSELESAPSTVSSPNLRNSWLPSPDASSVPWSPGAFDHVKAAHLQSLHQTSPRDNVHEVYEMPAEAAAGPSPPAHPRPLEMPSIAVTSPTVSPASRYSGANWGSEPSATSEPSEPRRYEPFRPR